MLEDCLVFSASQTSPPQALRTSSHLSSISEHRPAGGGQHLPKEEMHFTRDLTDIFSRNWETVWGWIPRMLVMGWGGVQDAEWEKGTDILIAEDVMP